MMKLTRRQMLGSSALLGASLLPDIASSAGQSPALPPSIAALKSRRAEAKPISREERSARQDRARALMTEQGLDAIVIAEGTSLNYFTGIRWWGSERLLAAVIPARGKPFFVCPAFEEGRAREQIALGSDASEADVRTWQEDESPYDLLARGFADRGIVTGKIGIEENVRFVFVDGIAKAAPQARLVSATAVTAGCRMIKSSHEVALMRLASEITLAAYEAAYHAIKVGMTQYEVAELTRVAHERLGFTGAGDLVLVGEYAAFPHGSVMPQKIREGTIVLIDGGCEVEGYKSDITRTFVLGKPSQKMRSVFSTVQRAQAAALAAAKPGVPAGAIDAAARAVITEAGYGPDYQYFTHRLGHGMGMDGHEWPYLVRGNKIVLRTGMTTSNEPGIYIRGEFGVRLEDDMLITESGAELLTPQSRSLEEPFARA
jgi:Xaa-Pro dipeptidase